MANILVAEDEAQLLEALKRVLTCSGHTVTAADNGAAAIELLKESVFDLVVLDMIMPDMDGFEVLDYIRGHSMKTPVLVMSGGGRRADFSFLQMAQQLGANSVLKKPFRLANLLKAVTRLLD
mgnify:CR=1 FL=1